MWSFIAGRSRAAAAAIMCMVATVPADAGEIADQATLAENLLGRGYDAAALSAFDKAASAFWEASPLQVRTAVFVDAAEGFSRYEPRVGGAFSPGDTMAIYLEPFGFTYLPDGEGVAGALAVDLQIQTPGGLILATSEDFGELTWRGRMALHEVHATVELPVPDLKPGAYQLMLTLRDTGADDAASVTLPFTIDPA